MRQFLTDASAAALAVAFVAVRRRRAALRGTAAHSFVLMLSGSRRWRLAAHGPALGSGVASPEMGATTTG
jgi:hypothetical protein